MSFLKRVLTVFYPEMNPNDPSPLHYITHHGGYSEMKKVKMVAKGKVQGVGFRKQTKILADRVGICGIVQNEENGSVYCEAIGTEENVDVFIKKVRQSPAPFGTVTHLTVEEDPTIKEYTSFEIIH